MGGSNVEVVHVSSQLSSRGAIWRGWIVWKELNGGQKWTKSGVAAFRGSKDDFMDYQGPLDSDLLDVDRVDAVDEVHEVCVVEVDLKGFFFAFVFVSNNP